MYKMNKRGKRVIINFFKSVLLLAIFTIAYLYIKQADFFDDKEVTFSRYPAFGIDLPTDYTIHGIDVSHHQNSINWKLVKEMKVKDVKVGFAIIKATEGIGLVDNQFRRNWKKAKEANITKGAYHYFIPYKSGKAQAQNFINTVTISKGDFPPVLDVETVGNSNATELQENVTDWLETVENYYKVKPIIYSNAVFYNNFLHSKFSKYPLWVAHYMQRQQPEVINKWIMWQHTENGHVNGINGIVDFNAFNGDSSDFKKLLVK